MTPGHIPLRVVCSRKFFEIAPFLKTLCSSFRLKVTCLHTNAGDKVCRLTFVKTRRDGIGVRERSVACTNGKSLRAKVVARRKLAYLLRILHRHIVLIVPNFGEKYSRIISMQMLKTCQSIKFCHAARELEDITNSGNAYLITQQMYHSQRKVQLLQCMLHIPSAESLKHAKL